MRSIDVRYLRLLWETPLIARLLEFNDSSGGVAAFLDHLETREIDVPLLKSVPNLAEYGRDLTRYLLFLHEIASSYILVPYIHDEKEVVKVEIEVKIDPRGVENDPECPIARVRIVRVSGAGTDTIAVHVSDLPHEYLIGNTARRIAELLNEGRNVMEPNLEKEPLTPAQKRVFDAIVKHISINRFPPSVRELCRDLGYSSPNAVTGFLRHLERKHWIKRPSTSRGIVIL